MYIPPESTELFIEGQLSCCRKIWLLPRPLPPSLGISKLSLLFSLPVCRRSSLLMGEGRNQIIRRRESLVFYESFNTLSIPSSGSSKSVLCVVSSIGQSKRDLFVSAVFLRDITIDCEIRKRTILSSSNAGAGTIITSHLLCSIHKWNGT
jgi:hypothetical protein